MDDVYRFTGGIGAFLVLFLDILILREIIISDRDLVMKLAWATVVILFPIFGVILYLLFGHDGRRGYSSIV